MSLASRAVALLQKQYEVVFHRMQQCQWSAEFGSIVSMIKDSVSGFHLAKRGENRRCPIEALEPRMLMTTLYWDPSAAMGLQAGSGAWDTTTQNWNTAADGSGAQVAWTNGADAVFAADGSSTVTISSGVTANSITFGGLGYTITGSTLTLTGSASITATRDATIADVIAGTAGLSETGLGILTLTGNNTYSGITTISSGSTLQLGNGGTTGSLSTGAITDNGLLIVNRSNAITMANVISGTGDVTQNGTNTLTLSGASTYTGTTTVNSGTLYLNGNTRLSSATSMVIANTGTLSTSGVEIVSSLHGSGTINLGSYTLTVGGDGSSTTYSGVISGTGGLTKTGAGTLTLTGANTYTGATTISGGALQIGDGGTTGTISTGAIINNGNLIINHNSSGSLTIANVISGTGNLTIYGDIVLTGSNSFTGGTTVDGSITLGNTYGLRYSTVSLDVGYLYFGTITSAVVGAIQGNGYLVLNNASSAAVTLSVGGNNSSTTYSGYLTGTGSLIKAGTGTLILASYDYYTGTTTISGGTLQLSGGIDLSGNIVNNGALIIDNDFWDYYGVISGTGSLTLKNSSYLRLNVNNTYSGTTTIGEGCWLGIGNGDVAGSTGSGAIVNNGELEVNRVNAITIANTISGTGKLSLVGGGSLTLSGSDTYSGCTWVMAGMLILSNANALKNSTVDLDSNGEGISFGSLTTANLGGLKGAAALALRNSSGSAVALTVGYNNSDTDYSGALSGAGSLTKVGTGALTLSGSNTYTGTTTINAGSLVLSGSAALSDTSAVTLANAAGVTLMLLGDETIGSLAGGGTAGGNVTLGTNTLTVGSKNTSTTFAGVISGTGNLTKIGTGIMTLSGANTFSGVTTVNAGTLTLTNINAIANSTFDTSGAGALSFGSLTSATLGGLQGINGLALKNASSSAVTLSVGANNSDTTFSGILSGSGGLSKVGIGTLILTGTNSNAGTTTVSAGTLQIGAGGAVGSIGTGTIVNNGTLIFNNSNTATVANIISGTGNLIQAGTGALILSNANNAFTGITKINSGTLTLADINALSGSTFDTSGSGNLSFGTLTSATFGGLTGTRDLVLSNASSAAVALQVGRGDNNVSTIFAGAFIGPGYLIKDGGGRLTLTGNTGYMSQVLLWGGTIQIGNGGTSGTLGFATISLDTDAELEFNRVDTLSVSGTITGSGVVALEGLSNSTIILTGNNSYTGATIVNNNNGTLMVGNGGTTGTLGTGVVVGGGDLVFNRSDTVIVSNYIGTGGNLSQCGTGTLILTGNNNVSGVTTIASGSLQIGNGETSGTLGTGNIVDNSTLVFNRSDAVTVSNVISGNGNLTKLASNTLTLNAANTFSGFTRISAGSLTLANSLALQNSTLDMNAADAGTLSFGSLTAATLGGLNGSRNLNLANSSSAVVALSVGGNNFSTTYTGVLSGTGSLEKTGTGSLILTGANSYTGTTRVDSGTLQIGNGGTSGKLGTGEIYNSGQLVFNRNDDVVLTNVIHNTGLLVQSGNGHLIFPAGVNINGNVAVNADVTADHAIIQQTSVVLSAGTTYILQVKVQGPTNGQLNTADYQIELRAGNTILAIDDNSLIFDQNQSLLSTLVYTASANLDVLGQPLEIWLVAKQSGSSAQITFSDIQLNTIALHLVGGNTSAEGSTYVLTVSSNGSLLPNSFNVEWGDGKTDSYTTMGDKIHTYVDGDAAGTPETILIRFYDSGGNLLSSLSKSISVLNVAPTITITGAGSTNEGDVYTLALGPVVDPGQDTIQQYVVDWGDGQTSTVAATDLPENRQITHVYTDGTTAGSSHQVFVNLVDEDGTYIHAANLDLIVYDNIPTMGLSGSDTVNEGNPYTLTLGEVSGLGYDSVKNYIISWGDGETSVIAAAVLPDNRQVNHIYADGSSEGTGRIIRVSVEDFSETYANIASLDLAVQDVAPSIAISGAASVNEGSPYTLTLGNPTDPGQDTVSGYIVDWGDGQTTSINVADLPADRSLTHVYADGASGGTPYTIQVGVVDEDGIHSGVANLELVVHDVAPVLTVSGAVVVNEGSPYTLTLGNPTDPGQDTVYGYIIDWGDGQTISINAADLPEDRTLTHVYADGVSGGTPYTIRVGVVDEDGIHSSVASQDLVVNDVAPILSVSGAANVDEGSSYALTLGAVTDPGQNTVSQYLIDWGDNQSSVINAADLPENRQITHVYVDGSSSGTAHTIHISVVDEDGTHANVASLDVSVLNIAPVAWFSNNGPVLVNSIAAVSFTNMFDPSAADSNLHYSFALSPEALATDFAGATDGITKNFSFDADGIYTIYGRIFDKDNGYTDYTTEVTVQVSGPTSLALSSKSVAENATSGTMVAAIIANDLSSNSLTYSLVAGDGSNDNASFVIDGNKLKSNTTFSYTSKSSYTIRIRATDADGLNIENTFTILVIQGNAAPVISSTTADSSIVTTATVKLSAIASDDVDETNLNYSWAVVGDSPAGTTFSANGSNTAKNTIVTFAQAGLYTFQVTVTDIGGQNATDYVTVQVDATLTNIILTPTTPIVESGMSLQFSATAQDQFGRVYDPEYGFFWSLSGGNTNGSIDDSGLYYASENYTGDVTVRVESEGVIATTTVNVVAPTIPVVATNLSAVAASVNRIEVTWTDNTINETGYVLDRSTDAAFQYNLTSYEVDKDSTSYTIATDVLSNVTYYFRLRAVNSAGASTNSNTATLTTPAVPQLPDAPVGLIVMGRGANLIDLAWQDVTANSYGLGESSYLLERATDSSFSQNLTCTTLPLDTTTYRDTGLTAGITYYYRIKAVNAIGWSNPSATISVIVAAASELPAIATAASANPVTATSATLSVLGSDEGGESSLIYTWSAISVPAGVSAPTFSGVTNGSNASKNITVNFTAAGIYKFSVLISNAAGLVVTSETEVIVNQTLSSIILTPGIASVSAGATQRFTALTLDQFGQAIVTQTALTWDVVTGEGAINGVGLYTAPTANNGSSTIRASSGTVSGQATLAYSTAGSGVAMADTAVVYLPTGQTTAINIDVLANDTPPQGSDLTLVSVSTPVFGTTQVDNNHIIYAPSGSYTGVENLTYIAHDRFGINYSGQLSININVGVSPRITDGDLPGTLAYQLNNGYVVNTNSAFVPTVQGNYSFTFATSAVTTTHPSSDLNVVTTTNQTLTVVATQVLSGAWTYSETFQRTITVETRPVVSNTAYIQDETMTDVYSFTASGDAGTSGYTFTASETDSMEGSSKGDEPLGWNLSASQTATASSSSNSINGTIIGSSMQQGNHVYNCVGELGVYSYNTNGGNVVGVTNQNSHWDDTFHYTNGLGTYAFYQSSGYDYAGLGQYNDGNTSGLINEGGTGAVWSGYILDFSLADGVRVQTGTASGGQASSGSWSSMGTGNYNTPISGGSVSGTTGITISSQWNSSDSWASSMDSNGNWSTTSGSSDASGIDTQDTSLRGTGTYTDSDNGLDAAHPGSITQSQFSGSTNSYSIHSSWSDNSWSQTGDSSVNNWESGTYRSSGIGRYSQRGEGNTSYFVGGTTSVTHDVAWSSSNTLSMNLGTNGDWSVAYGSGDSASITRDDWGRAGEGNLSITASSAGYSTSSHGTIKEGQSNHSTNSYFIHSSWSGDSWHYAGNANSNSSATGYYTTSTSGTYTKVNNSTIDTTTTHSTVNGTTSATNISTWNNGGYSSLELINGNWSTTGGNYSGSAQTKVTSGSIGSGSITVATSSAPSNISFASSSSNGTISESASTGSTTSYSTQSHWDSNASTWKYGGTQSGTFLNKGSYDNSMSGNYSYGTFANSSSSAGESHNTVSVAGSSSSTFHNAWDTHGDTGLTLDSAGQSWTTVAGKQDSSGSTASSYDSNGAGTITTSNTTTGAAYNTNSSDGTITESAKNSSTDGYSTHATWQNDNSSWAYNGSGSLASASATSYQAVTTGSYTYTNATSSNYSSVTGTSNATNSNDWDANSTLTRVVSTDGNSWKNSTGHGVATGSSLNYLSSSGSGSLTVYGSSNPSLGFSTSDSKGNILESSLNTLSSSYSIDSNWSSAANKWNDVGSNKGDARETFASSAISGGSYTHTLGASVAYGSTAFENTNRLSRTAHVSQTLVVDGGASRWQTTGGDGDSTGTSYNSFNYDGTATYSENAYSGNTHDNGTQGSETSYSVHVDWNSSKNDWSKSGQKTITTENSGYITQKGSTSPTSTGDMPVPTYYGTASLNGNATSVNSVTHGQEWSYGSTTSQSWDSNSAAWNTLSTVLNNSKSTHDDTASSVNGSYNYNEGGYVGPDFGTFSANHTYSSLSNYTWSSTVAPNGTTIGSTSSGTLANRSVYNLTYGGSVTASSVYSDVDMNITHVYSRKENGNVNESWTAATNLTLDTNGSWQVSGNSNMASGQKQGSYQILDPDFYVAEYNTDNFNFTYNRTVTNGTGSMTGGGTETFHWDGDVQMDGGPTVNPEDAWHSDSSISTNWTQNYTNSTPSDGNFGGQQASKVWYGSTTVSSITNPVTNSASLPGLSTFGYNTSPLPTPPVPPQQQGQPPSGGSSPWWSQLGDYIWNHTVQPRLDEASLALDAYRSGDLLGVELHAAQAMFYGDIQAAKFAWNVVVQPILDDRAQAIDAFSQGEICEGLQHTFKAVLAIALWGMTAEQAAARIGARGGEAALAAGRTSVRVGNGAATGIEDMAVVRTIQRGEKIADIIKEAKVLTYETGKEHALVKLATGERALVSGGQNGIRFYTDEVTRVFGHTHPYQLAPTGPSSFDFDALRQLGQRSSYLLEHGELIKF